MKYTELGNRIKGYENCYRTNLPNGFDVIVRVDGRAFHTFCKHFYKPFDLLFMSCMKETAKYLCANIQGAKFAYTQSDEISLWLHYDYENGEQPWFGNNVQKIVSIAASMATLAFNKKFAEEASNFWNNNNDYAMAQAYGNKLNTAMFDARVFILPLEEVPNYFLWRQKDAERNSIQMVTRSLYSHKELVGKKTADLHEMIWAKGQNWNDYPVNMKRGTVIVKNQAWHPELGESGCLRNYWDEPENGEVPESNYYDWEHFVLRKV